MMSICGFARSVNVAISDHDVSLQAGFIVYSNSAMLVSEAGRLWKSLMAKGRNDDLMAVRRLRTADPQGSAYGFVPS